MLIITTTVQLLFVNGSENIIGSLAGVAATAQICALMGSIPFCLGIAIEKTVRI